MGLSTLLIVATLAGPLSAHGDSTVQADTSLAGITTDTGDFARGRTSFARYSTPQLCRAAAKNSQRIAQRTIPVRTAAERLSAAPTVETLPTAVVEIARRCASSFSVRTVPPRDLPELLLLALDANQDALVLQVLERQLSLVSTPVARDSVLLVAMHAYLNAQPPRIDAAAALVDRVAEGGGAGRRWRLGALTSLLEFSKQSWDRPATSRFANRILDEIHALPPAQRQGLAGPLMTAYSALGMVAYLGSPDSVRAIAQRARQDWLQFPTPTDSLDRGSVSWDLTRTASVDAYVTALSPVPRSGDTSTSAYPRLDTPYWFPNPLPSGAFRLVISSETAGLIPGDCLVGDVDILYDPVGRCFPFYERIRDLAARYQPRGLQIVLLAMTHGQAIRSLPLTPEQEVARLKWYFLDYLKLPVTLAIAPRPVYTLSDADQRQWRRSACESSDPETDTSTVACKYINEEMVFLGPQGERIPLWGPASQQDHILDTHLPK